MTMAEKGIPLCFTGALFYVSTLMFAPAEAVATVPLSEVMSPPDQIVIAVVAMAASTVATLVGSLLASPARLLRGLCAVSFAATVAGVLCALVPAEPWMALLAMPLLSVATVAELYLGARACQNLPGASIGAGVAGSLLLATCLSFSAAFVFTSPAVKMSVLGSALLICAGALGWRTRCETGTDAPAAAAGAASARVASDLNQVAALLRHDWRSLAGCATCALLFGSGVHSDAFPLEPTGVALSFAGRLAGLALAAAVFMLQERRPAANYLNNLTLGIVALAVAAQPLSELDGMKALGHVLPACSQALFIVLLLVETQLTGREARRPASLTMAGFALFLVAWMVGGALGLVLSSTAIGVVTHLLYIACLCLLLTARARREGPRATGSTAGYTRLVAEVCRRMSGRYGLSAREGEVLPLLIVGLAPATIAERLVISPYTVKTYVRRIYTKLDVHSREELAVLFNRESGEE